MTALLRSNKHYFSCSIQPRKLANTLVVIIFDVFIERVRFLFWIDSFYHLTYCGLGSLYSVLHLAMCVPVHYSWIQRGFGAKHICLQEEARGGGCGNSSSGYGFLPDTTRCYHHRAGRGFHVLHTLGGFGPLVLFTLGRFGAVRLRRLCALGRLALVGRLEGLLVIESAMLESS